MKRYDIFKQIHKGLRALLYETALKLQQTDFSNSTETGKVLEETKHVIDFFENHADKEDNLVFPAIASYEPSVVDAFEQEHITDKALGLRLEESILSFSNAVTVEEKIVSGELINLVFTEFVAFNLKHMAMEEDIINDLLWRYYADVDLHGITEKIIAKSTPGEMAIASKWMMRGLNNNEITDWLKNMKLTAPPFAFMALLETARQELDSKRLDTILSTLSDGAMVA